MDKGLDKLILETVSSSEKVQKNNLPSGLDDDKNRFAFVDEIVKKIEIRETASHKQTK